MNKTNKPDPKKGNKKEQTRIAKRALLKSALEIISESGLRGLTLAAVGERAGYSRGLVRYHFGSKDALILALIEWAIEDGKKIQKKHFLKGMDTIITGVDYYAELLKSNPGPLRGYSVLTAEMSYSDNSNFRKLLKRYLDGVEEDFADSFVEEGFSEDVAKATALFLTTSIRGLAQMSVAQPERDMTPGFEVLKNALRFVAEHKD